MTTAAMVEEAKARLARLSAAAPDLLALAYQYRNDMMFGVRDEGSKARRIEAIDAALAKVEGRT